MPTQITATVVNVVPTTRKNVHEVVVNFNDGKGTWQKTYQFSNTHQVKLARFKEVVEADIRKDLKPQEDTMEEIKKVLNKPIIFTI